MAKPSAFDRLARVNVSMPNARLRPLRRPFRPETLLKTNLIDGFFGAQPCDPRISTDSISVTDSCISAGNADDASSAGGASRRHASLRHGRRVDPLPTEALRLPPRPRRHSASVRPLR